MDDAMTKRSNALPEEAVRWNLSVSSDTDSALRKWLAGKGAKRGDLSRFVEDAVNRQVLREMINDIHARNAHLRAAHVEQVIENEMRDVRANFWPDQRS